MLSAKVQPESDDDSKVSIHLVILEVQSGTYFHTLGTLGFIKFSCKSQLHPTDMTSYRGSSISVYFLSKKYAALFQNLTNYTCKTEYFPHKNMTTLFESTLFKTALFEDFLYFTIAYLIQ